MRVIDNTPSSSFTFNIAFVDAAWKFVLQREVHADTASFLQKV